MKTHFENGQMLQTQLEPSGVLRLTLNDPARRNALSEAMMTALGDALERANHNTDVRVIILAAVGSVFCSGHD